MEIRLGENDSCFNGGKAKMIIIQITMNNGKKNQFPYDASKTLSELCSDIQKFSDEEIVVPSTVSHAVAPAEVVAPLVSTASASSDGEIHKECLVKCIKVEPRGDGATIDLEVGKVYRVLTINGPTSPQGKKHAMSYELVDDNAPSPMRIFALPHEVIFYQNRKPPIPKVVGKLNKAGDCPVCSVSMVFYKEPDGRFIGECLSCHNISELKDVQPSNTETTNLQSAAT